MTQPPDAAGDNTTVDAVGKATEALEYVERARGHLYAFHQLIGRADFLFEQSAVGLAAAGRRSEAASLWRNVVGRDVLEGRWTFQIVEGFDDDYYNAARIEVIHLEDALVGSRRHAHEEQLREQRRAQRAEYLRAAADEPREAAKRRQGSRGSSCAPIAANPEGSTASASAVSDACCSPIWVGSPTTARSRPSRFAS